MVMSELALKVRGFLGDGAANGTAVTQVDPDTVIRKDIPLQGIRLLDLVENPRTSTLDRQEAYFYGAQDAGKRYDWDGRTMGYGAEAGIKPGFYIPYAQRRPMARYDMGTLIVTRLTSMLFGTDRFPEIKIEGDEDAEDYVKQLAKESRLTTRMIEMRNKGGAVGSVGASFSFKKGKPRIEVHNAKHLTVLRWADEDERIVGAVLETYKYKRKIYDPTSKQLKDVWFYYARYWDETEERLWEPIPTTLGDTEKWVFAPNTAVSHNFGFCPFYWVQNTPDTMNQDGAGDYAALTDNFDAVNRLLSASSKGVTSTCDPTLVIHAAPVNNTGTVDRGHENAIYSEKGASYLTLPGDAPKAALEMAENLRKYTLDVANVVLADPEKLSGTAQSAQALRILYAPMLAQCDILREQYGDHAIVPILQGMLRAAKLFPDQIVLAQRVKTLQSTDKMSEGSDKVSNEPPEAPVFEDRKPGNSENIELNWNPYFSPTWTDIKMATDAVLAANGQKSVISQKTSVQAVQSLFGVTDVDEELRQIHEEGEQAMESARRTMEMEQDVMAKGLIKHEGEDTEESGNTPAGQRGIAARDEDS